MIHNSKKGEAMNWKEDYKRKVVSLDDAAKQVKSGDHVGIGLGIGACSPRYAGRHLNRWEDLRDVSMNDSVPVRPSRLYDLGFMLKLDGHINYNPVSECP